MKIVVGWLCMIALAVASCSIKHSSGQFECESSADCAELGEGRVCSDGLCIVPGGGTPKDAALNDGIPKPDAPTDGSPFICPPQCTQCNAEKKECVIDCANDPDSALCMGALKCPAGFSCLIKCNEASACRAGIDCTAGTACKIECSGFGTCRNVTCGPGACDVTCSGQQSCGGATTQGINCASSCACDVNCENGSNCSNITCPALQCDVPFDGCSSEPQGCDTCP